MVPLDFLYRSHTFLLWHIFARWQLVLKCGIQARQYVSWIMPSTTRLYVCMCVCCILYTYDKISGLPLRAQYIEYHRFSHTHIHTARDTEASLFSVHFGRRCPQASTCRFRDFLEKCQEWPVCLTIAIIMTWSCKQHR